jgi:hypothetical protein
MGEQGSKQHIQLELEEFHIYSQTTLFVERVYDLAKMSSSNLNNIFFHIKAAKYDLTVNTPAEPCMQLIHTRRFSSPRVPTHT